MPIEIRELNIKVNVSENQNNTTSGNSELSLDKMNEIVSQCVEQVMEIISKTHER